MDIGTNHIRYMEVALRSWKVTGQLLLARIAKIEDQHERVKEPEKVRVYERESNGI